MKTKTITALLVVPLLIGCGGNNGELVIKIVDPDYTPTLPTYKDKDKGAIKEDENNVYFDFYEISDYHGAVVNNKDDGYIGLERLSSYYDKKREDNPGGSFIVSSGDMWQGSADSNITRGNLVTYGMNVMNFASMTLGNHEFDWTVDWIKNNKERARFPLLCANLIDKSTSKIPDFVSASTTITRGNYKVGIVGTIGDNIKDSILATAVTNYDFADEVSTVVSETAKLRESGCDIVVWTSHNDIEYLKNKIGSTKLGVDLIFGGHSHSALENTTNDGILMLESRDYGRGLPHAQLKMDKKTKAVSVSAKGFDDNPAAGDYAADADITGIYKQYSEKYIDPVKNQNIGKADGDFDKTKLGNLAVESMFNKIKEAYPDTDPRACFTNVNGGIRNTFKSGKLIYGDVYKAFPFDNEIVICETTGSNLQNFAAGSVSNVALYQNIYTYGALNADQKYKFITTDFLALNSDFFSGKCTIVNYTKLNLRDCLASAIMKAGTIKADEYKITAKKEFSKIK